MKDQKRPYLLFVVTFIAVFVFFGVLVNALWYSPDSEVPLPAGLTVGHVVPETATTSSVKVATAPAVILDGPVRLTIPILNIDAKVQDVGINAKGNMATPNNFTDVGWYKYGTVPGKLGSAVIAGHVDDGLALPGVFKHLGDLKQGDDIYVTMSDGTKQHYIVQALTTYDYDEKVPEVFEQNDNRYLKLITCAGVFVESFGTHNKRLVVTAVES